MRRVLALSALVSVALAPLASAAPTASPESGSATQFRVTTRAGIYTMSLLASTSPAGGPARLRVRLLSSTDQATRFAGALPASALVTAGGITTLRTRLGSVPLRVVFHPEAPVLTVSFGNVDADNDSTGGWLIAGNGGTAEVALGAVRCTVTLMASGTATVLDTGSDGRPLSSGLGLRLNGAKCGDLPSTPLPVP